MGLEAETVAFEYEAVVDGSYELMAPVPGLGLVETWQARDPRVTTRTFSMKLLQAVKGRALPSALADHIRALQGLRHEGIVPTLGQGVWRGHAYLVQGPLQGTSLARYLQDRHTNPVALSLAEIEALFGQVAAAVSAAHGAATPVVHGDLQPEVLEVSGVPGGPPRVRVMDFGLVPFLDASASLRHRTFVAPERDRLQEPRPSLDVFSLGRILRMLLGEPSRAADALTFEDGFRGRRDVPDVVWKVIEKATLAAPERRWESVAAFLVHLGAAWRGLEPVAVPVPPPPGVPSNVAPHVPAHATESLESTLFASHDSFGVDPSPDASPVEETFIQRGLHHNLAQSTVPQSFTVPEEGVTTLYRPPQRASARLVPRPPGVPQTPLPVPVPVPARPRRIRVYGFFLALAVLAAVGVLLALRG